MIYDGKFEHNNEIIDYWTHDVDGNSFLKNGNMRRYITFYKNGNSLGRRAIYGSEDDMTNIDNYMTEQWYKEYLNKKS